MFVVAVVAGVLVVGVGVGVVVAVRVGGVVGCVDVVSVVADIVAAYRCVRFSKCVFRTSTTTTRPQCYFSCCHWCQNVYFFKSGFVSIGAVLSTTRTTTNNDAISTRTRHNRHHVLVTSCAAIVSVS